MYNVICDLDGTISNDHKRAEMFLRGPCHACGGQGHPDCVSCGGTGKFRNWTPYFEACHTDEPMQPIIQLLQEFAITRYNIFIMSGRCESVRQKTQDWLDKYDVPYNHLYMRPIGNRVDDHKLKIGWGMEKSPPQCTLLVLEDRQRVVDAWRSAGYTCLQVAPGNF